jgi:hypothetical protein
VCKSLGGGEGTRGGEGISVKIRRVSEVARATRTRSRVVGKGETRERDERKQHGERSPSRKTPYSRRDVA